jgi:hypothetical protein
MQDRRPGQCGLPDVAGDLRIQFAETGQDGQAAQTQNERSQPQSIVRTSPRRHHSSS